MSNCIEPTNIIPNNNQVVLQDVNKTITVIDNNCCTTTNVTQPVTNVIQVNTLGAVGSQGPPGDPGPSGSSAPFIDLGNGVWATTSSIQVTGSLTISGSSTLINIGPTIFSGSLIVTSGITGSLSGSVTEAISSSYALSSSYSLSSSYALSSSFSTNALTASFISTLRATGSNNQIQFNISGNLATDNSFYWANNNLFVLGAGGSMGGFIGNNSTYASNEFGIYDGDGYRVIALLDQDNTKFYYSNGAYSFDGVTHALSGSFNVSDRIVIQEFGGISNYLTLGYANTRLYFQDNANIINHYSNNHKFYDINENPIVTFSSSLSYSPVISLGDINSIGNLTKLVIDDGNSTISLTASVATLNGSQILTTSNTSILTLIPQHPLPGGVSTGTFAVSASTPPKPYFYNGTSWNALY